MFLLTVCVLGFCFRILAVNLGLDFCQNPSTNGCKSEVTLVLGCAFIYKGGFQRQGQKLGVGERGVGGGGGSLTHQNGLFINIQSVSLSVHCTENKFKTSEQLVNNADVLL